MDSLRTRILNLYKRRPGEFINGGDIERLALDNGYKASNASRRLRELHAEGLLDREERKGKGVSSVWYKWKQPAPYTMSLITNQTVK